MQLGRCYNRGFGCGNCSGLIYHDDILMAFTVGIIAESMAQIEERVMQDEPRARTLPAMCPPIRDSTNLPALD